MKPDVQLFACLCIEQRLIDLSTCQKIGEAAGEDAELLQFAELLIDMSVVQDVELLQTVLDDAWARVEAGEQAPFDPFAMGSPEPAAEPPAPAVADAPEPDSLEALAAAALESLTEPRTQAAPAANSQQRQSRARAAASQGPPRELPADAEDWEEAAAESVSNERPSEAVMAIAGNAPALPNFASLAGKSAAELRPVMISLLLYAKENGISDLHICADARPAARRNRALEYLEETVIDAELSKNLLISVLSPEQRDFFLKKKDYDFALAFDNGGRLRVNLRFHKDGPAGTFRTVPDEVPTLEDLGFAEEQAGVIRKLLSYHNGLILVTGPVGAGKTTTLAALVKEINGSRTDHIICVEEPIEIIHRSDQCSVTQRGVGPHTKTFHSALKGALRQDPDIIVIGEMRDLETIEMAISASETGHLVIGTMHTADAASTLNRILDVFPPAQQTQIRAMVAESLRGILCQRLLPNKKGSLTLAPEILLRNTAVSSLIREGKSDGLGNIMETGKRLGMVRMDNSVLDLWRANVISDEIAMANIQNRSLHREIRGEETGMTAPAPDAGSTEKKKRGLFG